MASFSTLTDSDILRPQGLSPEVYQLVYGIFYYTQMFRSREENLYNLAITLCNNYIEYPLLRELKVEQWTRKLDEIREKVIQLQEDNKKKGVLSTYYHFPFFRKGRGCTTDSIIQSIELMKKLLKAISSDLTSIHMKLFSSQSFAYPLNNRETLFIDLAKEYQNKYLEWQEDWEKAGDDLKKEYLKLYDGICPVDVYSNFFGGILWELVRNDYGKDYLYELDHTGYMRELLCTPENEWLYREYFFANEYEGSIGVGEIKKIETAQEMSVKKRTGVLRYMLESFGVKDKESARKLIHFALFHGHKKYNSKTDSNDTVYSYLHNDKQLFKLTEDIKAVLDEYDVPIPEGLKELDKRVFD